MTKQTREQYLAGALSRRQPWMAEGISRRTWERRRKQAVASQLSTVASPPGVANPVASPSDATWTGLIGQQYLGVVADYFDTAGSNVLTKSAVEEIRHRLPNPIRTLSTRTLQQGYRRAMECRPTEYDRWLSLIRQWGSRHQPWLAMTGAAAREFLDDLIATAGKHRLAALGDYINHVDRQRYGWKSTKLARLRSLRDTMKDYALKGDLLYSPMLMLRRGRTESTDAIAPAILDLMGADPRRLWTLAQFARRLRKSRQTIYLVTMDMRLRGEIVLVDEGRGLYALPKRDLQIKKSVSVRMLEKLIANGAMRFIVLESEVGAIIAAPLFRLRRAGVLEPGDASRRSPIKFVGGCGGQDPRGMDGGTVGQDSRTPGGLATLATMHCSWRPYVVAGDGTQSPEMLCLSGRITGILASRRSTESKRRDANARIFVQAGRRTRIHGAVCARPRAAPAHQSKARLGSIPRGYPQCGASGLPQNPQCMGRRILARGQGVVSQARGVGS